MKRFRIRNRKGETFVFSVDDEDAGLVRAHPWHVAKFSAGVYVRTVGGLYLHQLIMGNPSSMIVDHKDRDTLNNCRSNLRVCTYSQNAANRKPKRTNLSRFKGVSYRKRTGRWRALCGAVHIGYFPTEEQAARAYDDAALRIWGEFALTNEMLGLYDPSVKGLANV